MTLESLGNSKLRIKNDYIREFLAEFLGIFVLMVFGVGINAQYTLSRGESNSTLAVTLGWSIAVSMGVWISGGVSGGHINPAVSLALTIVGKMKFRKMLVYWVAQYLGVFVGSACVYGIYYDALNHFDGGVREAFGPNGTAGIWATYPNPKDFLRISSGFADQIFGTMMLMLCVMAVTDQKNMKPPNGMLPFCIGLIVFVIGTSYAMNCGYAINPARDISARLFTAVAGWGSEVFSAYNYWFWVPLVAPHIGAVFGAFIYLFFIGFHIEDSSEYDVEQKPGVLRDFQKSECLMTSDKKKEESASI